MTLLTSNQAHQAEQMLKTHALSRVHIHSAAVLLGEVMQYDCTAQSTPQQTHHRLFPANPSPARVGASFGTWVTAPPAR